MNPYQFMGIIACCTMVFAGVVTFLTMQGVPLLLAFLGVYIFAVWVMIGMQRRARQCYDRDERAALRSYDRETAVRRVRINDLAESTEDVVPVERLPA